MTLFAITSDTVVASGVAVTPTANGDQIYVANDVLLATGSGITISSNRTDLQLIVNGTITSPTLAVQLFGNSGTYSVAINENALVYGTTAGLQLEGNRQQVTNAGTITAGIGMFLFGNTGSSSTVHNSGAIYAHSGAGVYHYISAADTLTFRNSGIVSASSSFYSDPSSTCVEIVINTGLMIGEINLGAGDDFYTGRRGGEVVGTVFGEDGIDTFVQANGVFDHFDGGDGNDILDFRTTGRTVVFLGDDGENAAAAAGDFYENFETVWGSQAGSDRITGDAGANTIEGFGRGDILAGGDGNDSLAGGRGQDVLTGGRGNDAFVFSAVAEGIDRITDFSATGAGNNDRFVMSLDAFGSGLAAGVLSAVNFRAGATNAAADADDRFVFRTTDQTLWFDQDGTGDIAPICLADLQAGATMTASDIVLVA